MRQFLLTLPLIAIACNDPPTAPELGPRPLSREEIRAFARDLDPLLEPTPFELGPAALPYDGDDAGLGGGDNWEYYAPDCDSYWPAAAASCAPTPGAIRTYSGAVMGSMCLISNAVAHCKPSTRQFADLFVKQAMVGTALVTLYVRHSWLFPE